MKRFKARRRWGVLVELLRDRPHAVGAEIGVKEGRTSAVLLKRLPGLRKLYCVDPWRYYAEYDSDRAGRKIAWPNQRLLDRAYGEFLRRIEAFRERVVVLREFSRDAAPLVPDGSLDFAFIDANHAYEFVREDIALWWPKVREACPESRRTADRGGGLLAGHDYGRWDHSWGVRRAVDEAFGDRVRTGPAWCWWVARECRGMQAEG